jgi:hypothetical protein
MAAHASVVVSTLSRRALGMLLLCLVGNGDAVAGLIRGQMTYLAYEAMREILAGDLRNLRTLL